MKVELAMDNNSATLSLIPETVFEAHLSLALESLNYTMVGLSRAYDHEGDERGTKITFSPAKRKKHDARD